MSREETIDLSWNFQVNPENTPWVIGYRFGLRQDAKNPRRASGRMRTRRYWVGFEIDPEGLVRWTGGVKPTIATLNRVQEAYARGRPGSNSPPDDPRA